MKKHSIQNGNLILVNSLHSLNSAKFEMELVKFKDFDISLDKRAMNSLLNLLKFINVDDEIIPVSGYRPRSLQKEVFEKSIVENGEEFTNKYIAKPGHSEHETGLAIDLGLNEGDIDYLRPHFPYEGVCQDFRITAPEFGFIERYPEDKIEITKIAHEPWHFRYVGYPHSKIIVKNNFSLEEYHEYIKSFDGDNPLNFRNFSIWYSESFEGNGEIISGNNLDGYIYTNF